MLQNCRNLKVKDYWFGQNFQRRIFFICFVVFRTVVQFFGKINQKNNFLFLSYFNLFYFPILYFIILRRCLFDPYIHCYSIFHKKKTLGMKSYFIPLPKEKCLQYLGTFGLFKKIKFIEISSLHFKPFYFFIFIFTKSASSGDCISRQKLGNVNVDF